MIEKYGAVKMCDWKKDHWGMLAYIECCCVDVKGVLDHDRMRYNETTRPAARFEAPLLNGRAHRKWDDRYSTRVKGDEQIRGHDDFDCTYDLEAAGLVEVVSITDFLAFRVKMTGLGWAVAGWLREHKANGGVFANFQCDI